MRKDRRQVLLGLGAAPFAFAAHLRPATAQLAAPKAAGDLPNLANFRTGDFVWPKKKGAVVPRMTRSIGAPSGPPDAEREAWEASRQRALAEPQRADISPEVAEKLKSMRFEDFERLYHTGPTQPSGDGPTTRGVGVGVLGNAVSVGHVGIIELAANGVPYVIEAQPNTSNAAGGIIRTRYTDWLKGYDNIQLWHGRVRDLDDGMRLRVLDMARAQLGKPYDFFNFDLNDDRGFYCSKLAWMCLWRAASIAADDNPDPRRGNRFPPWFSPKQLISAKRIEILHKPGEY